MRACTGHLHARWQSAAWCFFLGCQTWHQVTRAHPSNFLCGLYAFLALPSQDVHEQQKRAGALVYTGQCTTRTQPSCLLCCGLGANTRQQQGRLQGLVELQAHALHCAWHVPCDAKGVAQAATNRHRLACGFMPSCTAAATPGVLRQDGPNWQVPEHVQANTVECP